VPAGGGNELPEPDGVGGRIGEGIVGAFDDRQQSQFQRHVALFEALDNVVDIGAAALAGDFDGSWATGEQQALLLDAGVAVQMLLKLVTLANSLPDVLVFGDDGGVVQPDGLLCHRRRGAACLIACIITHGVALTAR